MLIALKLQNVTALLANLNTRTEKSGDEDVPAADINIELNAGREVLDFFSTSLKTDLFDEHGPRDLADGVTLKHPEVRGPLGIEGEMTGAKLIIEHGVGKPMELIDVTVTKFKITPVEGGSVALGFQVQAKPDEKQIGKLYIWQRQKITIGIVPAELPEMDDGDELPPTKGKRVPKTADGATVQ